MARTPDDRSIVVAGLADELPVTTSATTSRSLVDNGRVRVVAFAFDAGDCLYLAAREPHRSRRSSPRSCRW